LVEGLTPCPSPEERGLNPKNSQKKPDFQRRGGKAPKTLKKT